MGACLVSPVGFQMWGDKASRVLDVPEEQMAHLHTTIFLIPSTRGPTIGRRQGFQATCMTIVFELSGNQNGHAEFLSRASAADWNASTTEPFETQVRANGRGCITGGSWNSKVFELQPARKTGNTILRNGAGGLLVESSRRAVTTIANWPQDAAPCAMQHPKA